MLRLSLFAALAATHLGCATSVDFGDAAGGTTTTNTGGTAQSGSGGSAASAAAGGADPERWLYVDATFARLGWEPEGSATSASFSACGPFAETGASPTPVAEDGSCKVILLEDAEAGEPIAIDVGAIAFAIGGLAPVTLGGVEGGCAISSADETALAAWDPSTPVAFSVGGGSDHAPATESLHAPADIALVAGDIVPGAAWSASWDVESQPPPDTTSMLLVYATTTDSLLVCMPPEEGSLGVSAATTAALGETIDSASVVAVRSHRRSTSRPGSALGIRFEAARTQYGASPP